MRSFKAGFSVGIDGVDQTHWSAACRYFADCNIYQTWGYETARSGESNVSHLLLEKGGSIVAAVQARLVRIPVLRLGMAYVLWGPVWKRHGDMTDTEVFRQAVRAVRAEYVGRRGLVVRLIPQVGESENGEFRRILQEEGYLYQLHGKRSRTIVMDLSPSLGELHDGMHQKWRYHLKKARKQNMELVDGEDDSFFERFESIYAEMIDRKNLSGMTDVGKCRIIQNALLPEERMRVFLCKADGELCAGGICSALGDTGLYLFGATSNRGTKTYGSYLVHWSMVEWVKSRGCRWYDLNGINPQKNPGGYQFKAQLAGAHGRDVRFVGQFDACPNALMRLLVKVADPARAKVRRIRERVTRLCGR